MGTLFVIDLVFILSYILMRNDFLRIFPPLIYEINTLLKSRHIEDSLRQDHVQPPAVNLFLGEQFFIK